MSSFSIKPIAILQYDRDNGPAYFAEYLRAEKISFEHVRLSGPSVQSYTKMITDIKKNLMAMRAVTQQIYGVRLGDVLERQVSITSTVI